MGASRFTTIEIHQPLGLCVTIKLLLTVKREKGKRDKNMIDNHEG